MNTLYFKDDNITLYTRTDHLMPEIQSETIDVILCDQPYGVKYQSHTRVATPLFSNMADDDNLSWVPEFLTEAYRVLKDPGALVLFTRWDVYGDWQDYIEEAKFNLKQIWHWDKSDSAGGTGDLDGALYEVFEWIIYATKGRYKMHSKRRSNAFRYQRGSNKERWHPIQKPESLLQDIIQVLCEGKDKPIICDPYSGSGSTLMGAKKLGIRAVGYELPPDENQQYANRMKERFQQSVMIL